MEFKLTKLNWQLAEVEPRKLLEYILSTTHPRGKTKAAFFRSIGFTSDNWQELSNALIKHGLEGRASISERTTYGTLYKVKGVIRSISIQHVSLISIWLVKHNEEVPRFITAYPK